MLVKFVDSVEEYWVLLGNINSPQNKDQRLFTVYIPKVNRLSTINCDQLKSLIRAIIDSKLGAVIWIALSHIMQRHWFTTRQ